MNDITILSMDFEDSIKKFIDKKFEIDNLRILFPNFLLREDVLDLLDKYCTVVYYPLLGEENNGFRLKEVPLADGTLRDFVFINTAQAMEKQLFTAAHELGHIWNVDEFVIGDLAIQDSYDLREHIINRFAAALLMPADEFRASVKIGLGELGNPETKTITYANLLKLIVVLMNQFFVPMKSVVFRLVELGFFRREMAKALFGHKTIPAKEIEKRIAGLAKELGYTKLLQPSMKKWIESLSEFLDIAEKDNLVSPNKIRVMREKFELTLTAAVTPEMNNVVPLTAQEG